MFIITLGIPMLLIAFFSLTTLPKWLNYKPFNCNVCLSFWLVLICNLLVLPLSAESGITSLVYAGMSAYFAIVLKRILNHL